MSPKKERRRKKTSLRKAARAILATKYGISHVYTIGYHALHRYIKQYRPDLKTDGYQLVADFVGNREKPKPAASGEFLESYEWRKLRMEILLRDGARCACCGASRFEGRVMHVDHIKPRRLFPSLALDPANLQVLCDLCNHGKGNWDQTDWR